MGQILVRCVPDDILTVLRQEAKRAQVSVDSVIVGALAAYVQRLDRRSALARHLPEFGSFKEQVLARRHGQPTSDSAELVRADRGK